MGECGENEVREKWWLLLVCCGADYIFWSQFPHSNTLVTHVFRPKPSIWQRNKNEVFFSAPSLWSFQNRRRRNIRKKRPLFLEALHTLPFPSFTQFVQLFHLKKCQHRFGQPPLPRSYLMFVNFRAPPDYLLKSIQACRRSTRKCVNSWQNNQMAKTGQNLAFSMPKRDGLKKVHHRPLWRSWQTWAMSPIWANERVFFGEFSPSRYPKFKWHEVVKSRQKRALYTYISSSLVLIYVFPFRFDKLAEYGGSSVWDIDFLVPIPVLIFDLNPH